MVGALEVPRQLQQEPTFVSTQYGSYLAIKPYIVPSNAPRGIKQAVQRQRDLMRPKWVSLYGNYMRICDGTNDDLDIQAAINLQAGETTMGPGQLNIGGSIALKTNTWLKGSGNGLTILKAKTALDVRFFDFNGAGASISDILLEDFKVDFNSANQTAGTQVGFFDGATYAVSNFTVRRLRFYDAKGPGIRHGNASSVDWWIVDCFAEDFTDAQTLEVAVVGVKRLHVNRNICRNIQHDACFSVQNSSGPTVADVIEVNDNDFQDQVAGYCINIFASSTAGPVHAYNRKVVVSGNTGKNVKGFLDLYYGNDAAGEVDITGNHVRGRATDNSSAGVSDVGLNLQAGAQFPIHAVGGTYSGFNVGVACAADRAVFDGVGVEDSYCAVTSATPHHGVELSGADNQWNGGWIRNSNRSNSANRYNIQLSGARNHIKNAAIGDTGTAKVDYDINITSAARDTVLEHNDLAGGVTGKVLDSGMNTRTHENKGYDIIEVVKAYNATLFNAAATTDSEVIWQQPANTILLSSHIVLDTAFVAAGLTDLDITIGDAGNNAGILNATMDLQSDAVGTKYSTKGAYFDPTSGTLWQGSATDWTAYVTSGGAPAPNLNTLSAGQVTFVFRIMRL